MPAKTNISTLSIEFRDDPVSHSINFQNIWGFSAIYSVKYEQGKPHLTWEKTFNGGQNLDDKDIKIIWHRH